MIVPTLTSDMLAQLNPNTAQREREYATKCVGLHLNDNIDVNRIVYIPMTRKQIPEYRPKSLQKMASKPIALITGANQGIGFEVARQLLSAGTHHVLLGARSAEKARPPRSGSSTVSSGPILI